MRLNSVMAAGVGALAALFAAPAEATLLQYTITGSIETSTSANYHDFILMDAFGAHTGTNSYALTATIDSDAPRGTGYKTGGTFDFESFSVAFNGQKALSFDNLQLQIIEGDGYGGGDPVTDIYITGNNTKDVAAFSGAEEFSPLLSLKLPGFPVSYLKPLDTSPLSLAVSGSFSVSAKDAKHEHYWSAGSSFQRIASPTIDSFVIEEVSSSVPEPANWMLLIVGFGVVGLALRASPRPVALRQG